MKQIQSRNSDAVFLVDDEDYEHLSAFNWSESDGYAKATNGHQQHMHRYLLSGRLDLTGLCVDHENLNKHDNQKRNLRVCTYSQNNANTPKRRHNTSGFKGVKRDKKRWGATIGYGGWVYQIGNFDTREEAAMAYDIRATETFGEFARLNFPNPDPALKAKVAAALQNPKKLTGRSRFYGVSFYSRWKARFKIGDRYYHLGYFDTEEEAARAVDAEHLRLGTGHLLNFPQSIRPAA